MFSDLRGKLNGSKFSKGRSAHTLTNKVKGANPQSSTQMATRAAFRKYTAKFKTLDEDVITAWNQAALEVSKSNAFGDSYKTTGHKFYVACNVNAELLGGTEVSDPPVIEVPTIVNITDLDPDSGTGTIKFETLQALDTGTNLVITATPQVSAGKTNLKGLYRVVKIIPAPLPASVVDITTEYTEKFGELIQGKKIGLVCYTTDTLKVAKFRAGAALAKAVK